MYFVCLVTRQASSQGSSESRLSALAANALTASRGGEGWRVVNTMLTSDQSYVRQMVPVRLILPLIQHSTDPTSATGSSLGMTFTTGLNLALRKGFKIAQCRDQI